MKKGILVGLAFVLSLGTSMAQSVPHSTHLSDQVVQGPCFIFAATAALESRALQSSANGLTAGAANFNEWQYFSKCALGGRPAGADGMIQNMLQFVRDYGASAGSHGNPTATNCPNPNDPAVPCIADFSCTANATWARTNSMYSNTPDPGGCYDDQGTDFELNIGGAHQFKLQPDGSGNLWGIEENPTATKIANRLSAGDGVIAMFNDWAGTGVYHAVFIYAKSGGTYSYKNSWPGAPQITSSALDISKCDRYYWIKGTVVPTGPVSTNCDYSISGNSTVPATGTRTYTLSGGTGSVSSISWTVPSTMTIVSGQGSSSLTVRSNTCSGATGATLSVSYSNGGSSCSASKSVTVYGTGSAAVNSISVLSPNWNSQGQTCPNTVLELQANDFTNPWDNTYYQWSIAGATILSGQGTSTLFIRTSSSSFSYQDYKVRAKKGNCAYSGWTYLSGTSSSSYCGGGGGAFRASLSSSRELSLEGVFVMAEDLKTVEVQVVSPTGQVLQQAIVLRNRPTLNLEGIASGLVFVRMLNTQTGEQSTQVIRLD